MKISYPSWLNRTVFGFGITSILSDTSHEIVPLLLPLLITHLVGKQDVPEFVALISGIAGLAASVAAFIGGTISDKLQYRKPLLLLGYFLTASFIGLLALSQSWLSVLIFMTCAWIGRGLVSAPRNALIADSTEEKFFGHVFGFRQALDTCGSIVGPYIVYLCSELPLRSTFVIALVPGFLAWLVIFFFIQDTPRTSKMRLSLPHLLGKTASFSKSFYWLLTVFFLFGIGSFNKTLIILRVQEVFSHHMALNEVIATVTLLYIFRNLIQTITSYLVGALSDHIGRFIPLEVFAFGFFGIMAVLLALPVQVFSEYHVWAVSVFFFSGISAGAYVSLQKPLIADLVPEYSLGQGFGLLEIVNNLGNLTSSIILGYLWNQVNPQIAFTLASAISLSSIAAVRYFRQMA